MDNRNDNEAGKSGLPEATAKSQTRRREWKAPELIKMDVADSTRGGGVPRGFEGYDYRIS